MTESKQTMYFTKLHRHKFVLQVIGAIKSHHAVLKCVAVLIKCGVIFS